MKNILSVITAVILFITLISCSQSEKAETSSEEKPYKLHILIDCEANLLFSKYDVVINLDGGYIDTMKHGGKKEYDWMVGEGTHSIEFNEYGNEYVNGKYVIENVSSDIDASVTINCNSDRITVSPQYEDRAIELEDDEIKLTSSLEEYKYKNYKDAVNALTELGFTNIKSEPIYDIYFGILTSQYELSSITIDSQTKFSKGMVFKKDSEVIIKYHDLEENAAQDNQTVETTAPTEVITKPVETTTQPQTEKTTEQNNATEKIENLTADNCEDFAEIITKSSDYSVYKSFSTKYSGKIIEFDGSVDYCTNHDDCTTRYDILLSAGDYSADTQIGPTFKMEDVAAYNLDLDTMFFEEEIYTGRNVHIIAKVSSFNENTGLFFLVPVSVKGR